MWLDSDLPAHRKDQNRGREVLEQWLCYIRCVWRVERASTQTDVGLPSPCHGVRSASLPSEGAVWLIPS